MTAAARSGDKEDGSDEGEVLTPVVGRCVCARVVGRCVSRIVGRCVACVVERCVFVHVLRGGVLHELRGGVCL